MKGFSRGSLLRLLDRPLKIPIWISAIAALYYISLQAYITLVIPTAVALFEPLREFYGVLSFRYRLESKGISIRKGLWLQATGYFPRHQISSILVTKAFWYRIFGYTRLEIRLFGTAQRQLRPCIFVLRTPEVNQLLQSLQPSASEKTENSANEMRLPSAGVLLYSLFNSHFLTLALTSSTVLSIAGQILYRIAGVSDYSAFYYNILENPAVLKNQLMLLFLSILILYSIAVLIASIRYFLLFYRCVLTISSSYLQLEHGLIRRHRLQIPRDKIRGIEFYDTLPMRILGQSSVYLLLHNPAASRWNRNNRVLIFPLLCKRYRESLGILREHRPPPKPRMIPYLSRACFAWAPAVLLFPFGGSTRTLAILIAGVVLINSLLKWYDSYCRIAPSKLHISCGGYRRREMYLSNDAISLLKIQHLRMKNASVTLRLSIRSDSVPFHAALYGLSPELLLALQAFFPYQTSVPTQ